MDILCLWYPLMGHLGHGGCIHIGVGSNVVCSTTIGNARASIRGMDNRTIPRFFMYRVEPVSATKRSDMITLPNVKTRRGETNPLSARFTPDAFPEAKSSKTGVSVKYALDPNKNWYVFRASYGREDKASDFLIDDGTYTYIAKKYVERYVRGKRKRYLQTLIPNILFVYTTEKKAEEYIKGTPALTYLTYYYNHFELDGNQRNPPLIVPYAEMEEFVKATCSRNKHLLFVPPSQCHFKSGELVKVIEGPFKGVEGRVARISGQQRVVVSLTKIGLISTAYIPTAFLRIIDSGNAIV